MIAIFTKDERQYKYNFKFFPKDKFVRIRTEKDIRGRKFDGVILYADYSKAATEIKDAFDILHHRQPDLFK